MDSIGRLIFFVIIFGLSAVIHEYAHAWMANRLGDPTAKNLGRLTLNPLAHIDPFGTVVLPIAIFVMTWGRAAFAYAKPVPFQPYNLRDQRWDPAKIAVAGPGSNILVALGFGLLVRYLPPSNFMSLPIYITYANILLAIFNLLPIPPLDGSKLLFAVLPPSFDHVRQSLERYGFIIFIVFILFGFRLIVMPIVYLIFSLITTGRFPAL